ncbi:MAG: TMEM175 family protein [Chthoniobacteraceae bacterium]
MQTGRLEAFSDGVIAIIITIMVLELKVPHGADLAALAPLLPVLLSYVLSFIYVGIYWNNHHHLFQAAERVNGAILWANLHLLFWLSLIPFVTGWMGENHFSALPTALYGVVLLMAAAAYLLLQCTIISEHGRDSRIATALGPDWKGKLSAVLYLAAIGLAFVNQWLADALYVLVAAIWFVPDRRLAQVVEPSPGQD